MTHYVNNGISLKETRYSSYKCWQGDVFGEDLLNRRGVKFGRVPKLLNRNSKR